MDTASDFGSAAREAIRKTYSEVANSAAGKFAYPTGREGAAALGYDPEIIRAAPARMIRSFCGVGHPFALGAIAPGEVILDFGCGGGFDLFVASLLTGEKGRVCGVDLTLEMVDLARANLTAAGAGNFEVRHLDSDSLPYADCCFDPVISNGVINLTLDKSVCFRELFRVLKPGGRIFFADVVAKGERRPESTANPADWAH